MIIEIDEKSGFCFGVVNAIGKAEKALMEHGAVYSLGDIVHNRIEMQRLEKDGLLTVSHRKLPLLKDRTVLIRAHGEPPSTYRIAAENGLEVIDATCPVVSRLQKRVKDAYAQMKAIGGQVVILGKKGHAEVTGLNGQVGQNAIIIQGLEDIGDIDPGKPVYLLSQTTQSLKLFEEVKMEILKRTADPSSVFIDDTICRQVSGREEHLRDFASRYDVIIFVSGLKSSNGRILYSICRETNPRSYMVEDETALETEWFANAKTTGICGATSTPKWLMNRVADELKRIVNE